MIYNFKGENTKKMKKFVKKMLALILVSCCIITLSACGNDDENSTAGDDNQGDVTNQNEQIKVGFVYIGVPGDEGFTCAHDQGRKDAEKILADEGIDCETLTIESVSDTDAQATKNACENLVAQGCDLIFTTSFGYMDPTLEVAEENPDVKFMHCSGYKTSDNMGNYFGKIYQARYLTGIVAGMKFNELVEDGTLTEAECKVGYVGAFPIAEVIRGIDAFTLGMQSVCDFATVEVKYTSTWYDPDIEYSTAKALINDGCHIIMQHQDTTNPQIAAEEAYAKTGDVFCIGYHTDMAFRAENANLCSAVWNFGEYYASVIKSVADGTWQAGSYWGDLSDGIVSVVFNDETSELPSGVKDAVAAVNDEFVNDGKKVFTGKIELESNLDTDGNEIADVISENGKYYYDCKDVLSDSYLSSDISWYVKGVTVSK